MSYIQMINSCKNYNMGENIIHANKDVTFDIEKGELAIILGASGAGKSTVLNILGGMDSNDSGQVIIDGKAHKRLLWKKNEFYKKYEGDLPQKQHTRKKYKKKKEAKNTHL